MLSNVLASIFFFLGYGMSEAVRTFSFSILFFFFGIRMCRDYLICIKQTFVAVMQPLTGALGGKLRYIPESAGVLSAGMEARIVREDGSEADFNEPGELWLRGNNVSPGYYNNAKATNETFVDGWLRTGDKFRIDEKGNFWCVLINTFFHFFFA